MANARRLPLGHDPLLLDFFQFILQEEYDPTLDNHWYLEHR